MNKHIIMVFKNGDNATIDGIEIPESVSDRFEMLDMNLISQNSEVENWEVVDSNGHDLYLESINYNKNK